MIIRVKPAQKAELWEHPDIPGEYFSSQREAEETARVYAFASLTKQWLQRSLVEAGMRSADFADVVNTLSAKAPELYAMLSASENAAYTDPFDK